jgi:excisionase family DNA binding protein
MIDTTNLPPVMTLNQAAAVLGMHRHTVVSLAKAGHIRGRQLGRNWRFTRDDILELRNGNSPETTQRR